MNIETSKVTKQNGVFFVEDIEDMLIRVDEQQVRKIMEETQDVEEKEVVVLLATIKENGIIQTRNSSRVYEKVDADVASISIIKLLNYFSINNLISMFEEMKYYQIKDVLEYGDPVEMLHNLL
jgi:Mg/Co/Ni transporter MgtE